LRSVSQFWPAGSYFLGVFFALSLVACSTSPGGMRSASEAVSSTATENPARARAKAHTELASQYYQVGNMAVALEEVGIALAADPSYAPVYSVRGLIQMYLRENEAADENFRKALMLAPGDPEINNNYGWFLCQIGREAESFKFFVSAVKNTLYQTPEMSLVNAGLCSLRVNDFKGAEEYYQKALAMGRNRQAVLLPLAQLEYRKGDFLEAQHHLAEYHRLVVPSAESLWLGVRVERKLDNKSTEGDLSAQLRRRFPESKEARELRRGNFE
jgi:type IV pilus assembly protein PilF